MSISLGDVASLIAALAFVGLVYFLARPLVSLAKAFDEARDAIKDLSAHTVPVLDEAAATVASTNAQMSKIDSVTTSAAEIGQNVSALTALVAATVGGPLIKVAAFSYGVRQAMADVVAKVRR